LAIAIVLSMMYTSAVSASFQRDIATLQANHARRMTDLAAQDARHETRAVAHAVATHSGDPTQRSFE